MRRGITLVELIVALVLIGMLAGLAAGAVGSLAGQKVSADAQELERARRRAIQGGRPVHLQLSGKAEVLFLPDGRAIGDSLDYLTGGVRHADR
jgi:prepilin-type N-terminal cleavage/methylation domain-containing protein